MKCISPVMVKRGVFVPCGKCNFCLQAKRADWTFRIKQELKVASSAWFLTLTYSPETIPLNPDSGLAELRKEDFQKFMKRLRKEQEKHVRDGAAAPLRYYSVGEYGGLTLRPHYHSILFNLPVPVEKVVPHIAKVWGNGHVVVGTVTPASIHYVTKYVINRNIDYTGRSKPFSLISNRSGGIGKNYVESNGKWHKEGKRFYTGSLGEVQRLPRYYKDRLFSVHEKEKFRAQMACQSVVDYWQEIARLGRYSDDACSYYEERIQAEYQRLDAQVLKGGKL